MDAFTKDAARIGVPTVASGASFQMPVKNLTIITNATNIAAGTGIPAGNIEFWPNNYGQNNSAGVPNASNDAYDFGDQMGDPVDGYGSMQVHNPAARQTLFAVNHWSNGANADIGIGNRPTDNPDWTFAGNGAAYPVRRLRVLVHCR